MAAAPRAARPATSGGRTAYTCNKCGRERLSSNAKADEGAGTTCPICTFGPVGMTVKTGTTDK